MSSRKNKPPLALGMDFNEALHRFARVDPKEITEKLRKKNSDENQEETGQKQ